MKIGVKIFKEKDLAKYFEDKADFLEVMAIPEVDYDFLKEYKLPIIIHCLHNSFGVNFADVNNKNNNNAINFAIDLANKCNSKKIIIHPGFLLNKSCSLEQAIENIRKMDKRIIIENCVRRENNLGRTPIQMKNLIEKTNKGFIFDINHAIESAQDLGKDSLYFIEGFLELNPIHFHLGGQKLGEKGNHLDLDKGDIPIKNILKKLPKDAEITIETGVDIKGVEKDFNYLKGLIKEIE